MLKSWKELINGVWSVVRGVQEVNENLRSLNATIGDLFKRVELLEKEVAALVGKMDIIEAVIGRKA